MFRDAKKMALTDAQKRVMIDLLVTEDIADIKKSIDIGDYDFLSAVLSGEGWKPYLLLKEDELVREFIGREFVKRKISKVDDALLLEMIEEFTVLKG